MHWGRDQSKPSTRPCPLSGLVRALMQNPYRKRRLDALRQDGRCETQGQPDCGAGACWAGPIWASGTSCFSSRPGRAMGSFRMSTFTLAGATGARATGPRIPSWGGQGSRSVTGGSSFVCSPCVGTDEVTVGAMAKMIRAIVMARPIATAGARLMSPVILPVRGTCKLTQSTQEVGAAPSSHLPSCPLLTQF
jgi:hypothetical protein